jgi:DNA-binding NtrC family response regulator
VAIDQRPLRDKVVATIGAWSEFDIVAVVGDYRALLAKTHEASVDLVILDAVLCRRGIAHDVEELAKAGIPVVVFTGRGSYPSVVELPGRVSARAIQLPKWVLDRNDALTSAHTRALLVDLTGRTPAVHSTGEVQSPVEAGSDDRRGRGNGQK